MFRTLDGLRFAVMFHGAGHGDGFVFCYVLSLNVTEISTRQASGIACSVNQRLIGSNWGFCLLYSSWELASSK